MRAWRHLPSMLPVGQMNTRTAPLPGIASLLTLILTYTQQGFSLTKKQSVLQSCSKVQILQEKEKY